VQIAKGAYKAHIGIGSSTMTTIRERIGIGDEPVKEAPAVGQNDGRAVEVRL